MMGKYSYLLGVALAVAMLGCAKDKPAQEPAVVEGPTATDIDPELATPAYWYAQPATVRVESKDFDKLWNACEDAVKERFFTIDRSDYRLGLMTTQPMVSKQCFEFWRSDVVTAKDLEKSTLATYRRTVRFDFKRYDNGEFGVEPKVLIERFSSAERRITAVVSYRGILAPGQRQSAVGGPAASNAPSQYWYATGRDPALEKNLAETIEKAVGSSQGNRE